jgi:hypothetical protein
MSKVEAEYDKQKKEAFAKSEVFKKKNHFSQKQSSLQELTTMSGLVM